MAELKIELIAIGDEILLGHTLDTNSHWIARRLVENGFRLRWQSVVGDNESDLHHQLKRAWKRADVLILTGGLGPTHDDITRPVAARFFEDELVDRSDLREGIRERFTLRGLEPPAGYEQLAQFPTGAEPIPNQHGSAPGIHYSRDGRELFSLPGVPIEMRGMVDGYLLHHLEVWREGVFSCRILKTTGVGESHLSELIGDPGALEPVRLAFLPSIDHGVTLRLSHVGDDPDAVSEVLGLAERYVRDKVGKYIYADEERSLEATILDELRRRDWKLALAESCTGGMASSRLVSIPGSSDVFERGFVTYSNRAKTELLAVDEALLNRYGAVSAEVAQAMAEGAHLRADVDIAVSITGIAGPSGGTQDKPVGLTYIGLADRDGTDVRRFRFSGDRDTNRRRSAQAALNLLWQRLSE